MTFKLMAAFAVMLAVATVSASLLGDLCYQACLPTEEQEQKCRAGCSPTGRDDQNVTTACAEQCVGIGAPCRIFCGENFRKCRTPCELIKDHHSCLVACIQQNFVANQTSITV